MAMLLLAMEGALAWKIRLIFVRPMKMRSCSFGIIWARSYKEVRTYYFVGCALCWWIAREVRPAWSDGDQSLSVVITSLSWYPWPLSHLIGHTSSLWLWHCVTHSISPIDIPCWLVKWPFLSMPRTVPTSPLSSRISLPFKNMIPCSES